LIDAKARAISQLLSRFGGRPKNGNKKEKKKSYKSANAIGRIASVRAPPSRARAVGGGVHVHAFNIYYYPLAAATEQKSPTGMLFLSNELLPRWAVNAKRLRIEGTKCLLGEKKYSVSPRYRICNTHQQFIFVRERVVSVGSDGRKSELNISTKRRSYF